MSPITVPRKSSGVVTSTSPGRVESGGVVYVVGRTPVRVVQAQEPFWRELSLGRVS